MPADPAQYMTALERANELRLYRADVCRQVKEGERDAGEVLLSDDPRLEGTKLKALLTAVDGIGPIKAARLLSRFHLSERIKLGHLSSTTRNKLLVELRSHQASRGRYRGRVRNRTAA